MITVCATCKSSFMNISNQPWCDACIAEDEAWEGRQNQSKKEESQIEKRKDDSHSTQSTEKRSQHSEKQTDFKILSAIKQQPEPIIEETKNPKIESEPTEPAEIESTNVNTTENFMPAIKSTSEASSMLPEIVETRQEGLQPNFVDLKTEISLSINLLNQSEGELLASMKGLRSSQPDTAVKLYDPDRVNSAVACGHQIMLSMKAKLDLMKFAKELQKENEQ